MSVPDFPPIDPLPVDIAPGVYSLHSSVETPTLAARFTHAGWATAIVDLEADADKAGIMDAFGRALGFPDWVGRNWDALDDALRDLSWWPAGLRGRLILVRWTGSEVPGTGPEAPGTGPEAPGTASRVLEANSQAPGMTPEISDTPKDHHVLRDVLETAVSSWAVTDSPLVVLLQQWSHDDGPGLAHVHRVDA